MATRITPIERAEHLRALAYEAVPAIGRGMWVDAQDRPCLLAAYSPEARVAHAADCCPATAMWPWLARVTPMMDDNGSMEAWPAMVRRYADVVLALSKAGAWENHQLAAETQLRVINRILTDVLKPVPAVDVDLELDALIDRAMRVTSAFDPLYGELASALEQFRKRNDSAYHVLNDHTRGTVGWARAHQEYQAAYVRYRAVAAISNALELDLRELVRTVKEVAQDIAAMDSINNVILEELERACPPSSTP